MRPLIPALLLCASVATKADEENYCHDAATNAQWQMLLADDHHKDSIVVLFALRDGLCRLVDAKVVTLERAATIFETERDRVLLEVDKTNRALRPEQGL